MLYSVAWFRKLDDGGLQFIGSHTVDEDSPADALAYTAEQL